MHYMLKSSFRGDINNPRAPRAAWWDAAIQTSDGYWHRNCPSGGQLNAPSAPWDGGYQLVWDGQSVPLVGSPVAMLAAATTLDEVRAAVLADIERAEAELEARIAAPPPPDTDL